MVILDDTHDVEKTILRLEELADVRVVLRLSNSTEGQELTRGMQSAAAIFDVLFETWTA